MKTAGVFTATVVVIFSSIIFHCAAYAASPLLATPVQAASGVSLRPVSAPPRSLTARRQSENRNVLPAALLTTIQKVFAFLNRFNKPNQTFSCTVAAGGGGYNNPPVRRNPSGFPDDENQKLKDQLFHFLTQFLNCIKQQTGLNLVIRQNAEASEKEDPKMILLLFNLSHCLQGAPPHLVAAALAIVALEEAAKRSTEALITRNNTPKGSLLETEFLKTAANKTFQLVGLSTVLDLLLNRFAPSAPLVAKHVFQKAFAELFIAMHQEKQWSGTLDTHIPNVMEHIETPDQSLQIDPEKLLRIWETIKPAISTSHQTQIRLPPAKPVV